MTATTAVVIPVRGFAKGKGRLGLPAAERAQLIEQMAEAVVRASGTYPVAIVSSAPEVQRWAARLGLVVLDDPGSLDAAAMAGVKWAAAAGVARVAVAHGDLPWARSLRCVASDASRPIAAIVPSRRDGGTPVVSIPTWSGFQFAYGPGSFRRHLIQARRVGLAVRVIRNPDLTRDVDLPEDLRQWRGLGIGTAASSLTIVAPDRRLG